MFRFTVLTIFLLAPGSVSAAIIINEIAWMGSSESANHEWIELYNNGSATDVTGWTLTDNNNLNIELNGSIRAGSYAVLERTSDESAPGSVFLIYTGALVNSGATLTLKKADGSIADQISGGENWQALGGDNTTKDTAQLTMSGWITAKPTPGQSNSIIATESDVEEGSEKDTSADSSGESTVEKSSSRNVKTVKLELPDNTLRLEIEGQELAYVNQSINFKVEPAGIGPALTDSLEYQWNFGDGMTENGQEITYSYKFPGTYVVTVYGGYKRQEQVARHEITVLPVRLSLSRNDRGDLQVNGDSPYELDLSGYQVIGNKEFTFPDRTILLSNQTITLAKELVGGMVKLFDDKDKYLTGETWQDDSVTISPQVEGASIISAVSEASTIEPVVTEEPPAETSTFGFINEDNERTEATNKEIPTTSSSTVLIPPQETTDTTSGLEWPYLALAGLLGVAAFGVFKRPN